MTTTRINHTGHNHSNTPAARATCRKATGAPTCRRCTNTLDVTVTAPNLAGLCGPTYCHYALEN